jgi:hypothetical protein
MADVALQDRSHERFLTALMNGHAFAAGPIRGMGSEVLGAFNFTSWVGAAAGVYLPNASFVAGVDFLRYSGINLPTKGRTFGLTILLPTVEARYAFSPGLLYLGSGLTGVRFTACPLVIDVRLPTVTVWQPLAFEEASKPSISVGATTSVAFMF